MCNGNPSVIGNSKVNFQREILSAKSILQTYHTTPVRTFSWCCWHVTFSETTRVIYFYAYSVTHDIPEATAAPDTLSLSKVVFIHQNTLPAPVYSIRGYHDISAWHNACYSLHFPWPLVGMCKTSK